MVVLGISQSPFYQLNVALRRLDPPPRLFLKGMEDINGLAKAHGIDSPVGVAVEVFD